MSEETWTPMIGLRRIFLRLLIRSAIALALWTALLWLVTPGLNELPSHWAWLLE